MKAQAFLELVGAARYEAINYYAKRTTYPIEAKKHLIKAKELEKRIDAVVKEGHLEPDEPPPGLPQKRGGVTVLDEQEEQQLRMELADEFDRKCMEEDDED